MAKTCFFWDEIEDNIVEEFDESGVTIADYTTEPYHFGNVISQHRGGQSSFFHCDALGSTLAVTDGSQNVTDTFAYAAYGEVTERTGTTEVPCQYIGQKGYSTDELTEQQNIRRRTYESTRARWLSPDPAGVLEELSDYFYVKGNPLLRVDPSGLIGVTLPRPMPIPLPIRCVPFGGNPLLWIVVDTSERDRRIREKTRERVREEIRIRRKRNQRRCTNRHPQWPKCRGWAGRNPMPVAGEFLGVDCGPGWNVLECINLGRIGPPPNPPNPNAPPHRNPVACGGGTGKQYHCTVKNVLLGHFPDPAVYRISVGCCDCCELPQDIESSECIHAHWSSRSGNLPPAACVQQGGTQA